MVMSRSEEDILVDNLLLLYVISKSTNLGATKLQKLAYLIECKFGKKMIKTFNYNFKRHNYGPFTKEIYEDNDLLVENDIVCDHSTQLCIRGKEILEQVGEVFEENKEITKGIDEIIEKYDKLSLPDLKKVVYESKVEIGGELIKVADVPKGTYLNTKLADDEAVNKFFVRNEWFNTLDILFDKELSSSLNKAYDSAKKHRSYKFNEVFSNV